MIGGKLKKSLLYGPKSGDTTVRPTYDRIRESIFDLLGSVEGLSFLDLYAGTGSVGIEALSRGATKAVFVDNSTAGIGMIGKNIEKLRLGDRAEVVKSDVYGYLKRRNRTAPFDVIFIDPPYEANLFVGTMELLGCSGTAGADTVIVGQHGEKPDAEEIGGFRRVDARRYGSSWISIWRSREELTK